MTGVWITLGIFLFFALLLLPSLTLYVSITDKAEVRWGVYGLRLKIPPMAESGASEDKADKAKKKRRKRKKASDDISGETPKKESTEQTFSEMIEFGLNIARAVLKGSEWLLKHLRIQRLQLCMLLVTGDAAETVLLYGKVHAGVYALLGMLDSLFTLTVKRIAISPSFTAEKSVYDISFKMKLRIIFIIIAAIAALWRFIKPILVKKDSDDKEKEKARKS